MIYECLHVYERSPMGRMAAESFGGDKVKGICFGDEAGVDTAMKVILHSPVTADVLPWTLNGLAMWLSA